MPTRCSHCDVRLPAGAAVCPSCSTPVDGAIPVQPRPTRFTGARLGGRWEVLGYIASGATSRVYTARDATDGTPVIVKMFAPQIAHEETLRALFAREGQAATHVDHKNVVRVLASGEGPEGPYLVMEALQGETLGDRLRRSSRFGRSAALELVLEAARGLAAVHAAGVVHRDVKPDNLFLLHRHEAGARLKLIDFGMAKLPGEAGVPLDGLVLGTPDYMAPEQILSEPVGPCTDVYALGVTLFRLTTGRLPFEGSSGRTLLLKQLFEPAPPPSWFLEAPDPWVDRIVRAATRKARENRYGSMDFMVHDLERALRRRAEFPRGTRLLARPDAYVPQTHEGASVLTAMRRTNYPAAR
jgi:serine/threonine-protein kinase